MFKGIITVIVSAISLSVHAQTSDSLIANTLRESNIRFSHDNSVTLLLSGQEKFDDMFRAIRQAKSSIHLEYFNFRNDSIASLLFDLLREKRKEGVEVRAMFDGFGNDSNNQPLKKYHLKPSVTIASTSWNTPPSDSRGLTTSSDATTVRLSSLTDR